MIKVPVSKLEGAQLDYAVAMACGSVDAHIEKWPQPKFICISSHAAFEPVPFHPSASWSDAGPIIERERIHIRWHREICEAGIKGSDGKSHCYDGSTTLIAAMRAFVASRLGNEVEAPDGQA